MDRRGLTLVELVVVIGVSVALMGIFLACTRLARAQARTMACQSNLRQLLLSFSAYENSHGSLPYGLRINPDSVPPGGWAGFATKDLAGRWWWFHALGYPTPNYWTGNKSILLCPSKRLKDFGLTINPLYGNYGVNRALCRNTEGLPPPAEFGGTPVSTYQMAHPSRTLLVLDSGYAVITWWHATDRPPEPLGAAVGLDVAYVPGMSINLRRQLWPGQWADAVEGRHPGRTVNVGFADGHSDRVKADSLTVEATDEGYNNLFPLWRPNRGEVPCPPGP